MLRDARPLLAFSLVLLASCATTPRQSDPLVKARAEFRAAEHKHSVALYLDAARHSLPLATNDATPAATRAEAVGIYNHAVAHAAVLLFAEKTPAAPGFTIAFTPPPRGVHTPRRRGGHSSQAPRGRHPPPRLWRLACCRNEWPDTAGPNRPPKGYAVPLTAVADFAPPHADQTTVAIRLLDPRQNNATHLAGAQRPLAGDFTASLAYYPHPNELVFGFLAMLRSDLSVKRSALMFYEPYDPKKIPVLFVHGS